MLVTSLPAREKQEFSKVIRKEFDISPNGTTGISNKYGKVDIKTWNQNRVKIEVTITVKASSEANAQKVFDRINIAFSNSADYVKAVTNIEPRKKGLWDWSDNENSDYAIDYDVFLPPTNNLDLEFRYGDAYVAELSGKVNADLKYANMKLEGIGSDSKISFAYGNCSIVKAEDISTDIGYAKLNINEAEDIQITSKYSKFSVERAAAVRSESKYDDYKLGDVREFSNAGKYDNIEINQADNVEVNGKYSQVNVGQVKNKLDLDLEYGGASSGLGREFREANLVGRYTDFRIDLAGGSAYRMDAAATYAGISYPRTLTVTYELEKNSSHEVKGYQGSQNAGAVINARLSYGGLKVREQ